MIKNTPDLRPINFNYSLKSIPISTNNKQYKIKMYEKVDKLITKMRWKAFHLNNESTAVERSNYDGLFPTKKRAPEDKNLIKFENDLYELINNLKFRKYNNLFTQKLNNDLRAIKSTKKVFVFADKSNSIYKVDPDKYKKLMLENVTSIYKKSETNLIKNINTEAKNIVLKNKIKGKIPKLTEQQSYITLKDHKPNFPSKISCRLINPAKTYIGKPAKRNLDKINNEIRLKSNLNQWKNTYEVLNWFKKLNNKPNSKFIKFDIVAFYPSISAEILENALSFAASLTEITVNEKELIKHCCKTVLFHEGEPWSKKQTKNSFDVPMGSFHGAEVCELVGLYILDTLKKEKVFGTGMFGCYRDDCLAIVDNLPGPSLERKVKKLRRIFKNIGFDITIEANLIRTDFLDVTLDLEHKIYMPYRKPNTKTVYVNKKSNHPAHVLNHIPVAVNKRLQKISSDPETFKEAIRPYQEAIRASGYEHELNFNQNCVNNKKRKRRRRNVLYFNAPFCKSVATQVGKCFLAIVDKNFTKDHPYSKVFNRKTLKISYSCMPNMKQQIMAHNRRILNNNEEKNERMCDCRKQECPVDRKCLSENVIYKATVKTEKCTKTYIGSTGLTFKDRFTKHKYSFRHEKHSNSTTLSQFIWKLKNNNIDFKINWEILARTKNKYSLKNGCTLCNLEKIEILNSKKSESLKKRNELQSGCLHYRKNFI